MKKAITILSVISGVIFSCTSEKTQKLFNSDNIRTQLFSINPQKENLIKGVRGGEFKIPAGAFEGTESVTIELKEIYAPIEILASGLTTESNGELLESGGMFYINAKRNGKELELLKPIDGSIPTEYINDSMKLFKGEVMDDGNVNWVEPEDLKNDTSKNEECIKAGQIIFWQNCASCHAVTKQLTGPALAGADKRITREMYYDFVENPAKATKKYSYFSNTKNGYGAMTAFPALQKEAIDCIIEFVNAAEKNPSLEIMPDSIRNKFWPNQNSNPCGYDTTYIDSAFSLIVKNALSRLNINTQDTISIYSDTLISATNTVILIEQEKYEFNINTTGWYNIDILTKDLEGTTDVDISATTDFENKKTIDVRIYLPEKKISLKGEFDTQNEAFYFGKNKSKIPMYIGDKAIVFAIAESDKKLYYSVQELKIQSEMKIILAFKQTTQSELDESFRKINLDNINLDRLTKKPVVVAIPCNQSDTTKLLK